MIHLCDIIYTLKGISSGGGGGRERGEGGRETETEREKEREKGEKRKDGEKNITAILSIQNKIQVIIST